jgi:hypothetical protein
MSVSWGDFWTGLTGFTGLEHNPQRIYEMNCLALLILSILSNAFPLSLS